MCLHAIISAQILVLHRTAIGGFTTPELQPHSIPLDQIAAAVSGGQLAVLSALRQLASEEEVPVYLVGGAVRDYVLGIPIRDLDFVVVGNATIVATELANNLSGTVTVHQRFGTATVEIDGDRVDIVTARKEAYASPGSLPEVSFSDLNQDLARRDFSINAMALPLSGESPNVIDPHGGLHDLANGSIAILHSDSFTDDPTRMLRAVRYEQRLGFQIFETTMAELKKSIHEGHVPAVSGDRWRQEFQKIFYEDRGFEMFSRAIEIGILPAIHPALSNDAGLAPLIGETGLSPCDYLAALVRDLSSVDGDAVSQRLNLPIDWARMVRDTIALKEITPTISETAAKISAICRLLEGLDPESIAASTRFSQDVQLATKLRRYLDEWRLVRTALTGDDLMAMGLTPGVKIGEVLQELHSAKLDGLITSETEERAMVNQIISRGS